MAIQISGTTVIDNSRNLTNVESIAGNGVATQAEAEAGTANDQIMTPLRVSQAISALGGGGMVDDDINWSGCNVGCAVRGGGNVIYKQSNIIWIVAPSTAQQNEVTWPLGYCSGDGVAINQAQRITGRSGWFVPDLGMMQTAYACRSYWDSYSVNDACYWTSTEKDEYQACVMRFFCGDCACTSKANNGFTCVRAMRIICY